MLETTNLKLKKQELTDPADITQINPNWDKIDSELTNKFDKTGGTIDGHVDVNGTISAHAPTGDNDLATKAYVDSKIGTGGGGSGSVNSDGVTLSNPNITKGEAPAQAQSISINFYDKDGTNAAADNLASVSYNLSTDKTAALNLFVSDPTVTDSNKQTGIRIQNVNGTPRTALTNHPTSDANDHSIATTAWVRGLKATTTSEGLMKLADENAFLNPTDPTAAVNVPLMYEVNDFRRISTAYEVGDRVACAFSYDVFLECTKAGTTGETTLDTRNVKHDQVIKDGTLEWTVRTHVRSVDGIVADEDGDVKAGFTNLVIKPEIVGPTDGEDEVSVLTYFEAAPYACIFDGELRAYREFQVVKESDPNFGAPLFTQKVDADKVQINSQLIAGTGYRWRCRDVTNHGLQSKWSDVCRFTTGGSVIVTKPTVTIDGGTSDVLDSPTFNGSAFSITPEEANTPEQHVSTTWRLINTGDKSEVHKSENDTVNKLSYTVPRGILREGQSYIMQCSYNSKEYGSSQAGEVQFTCAQLFISIDTPTISIEGGTSDVFETPTFTGSAFNISPSGYDDTHVSTTWILTDATTLGEVWRKDKDEVNKTSLTLQPSILMVSKSYVMSVIYHGEKYGDSKAGKVQFTCADLFVGPVTPTIKLLECEPNDVKAKAIFEVSEFKYAGGTDSMGNCEWTVFKDEEEVVNSADKHLTQSLVNFNYAFEKSTQYTIKYRQYAQTNKVWSNWAVLTFTTSDDLEYPTIKFKAKSSINIAKLCKWYDASKFKVYKNGEYDETLTTKYNSDQTLSGTGDVIEIKNEVEPNNYPYLNFYNIAANLMSVESALPLLRESDNGNPITDFGGRGGTGGTGQSSSTGTKGTEGYGCFSNCSGLTTLPSALFKYNINVTNFGGYGGAGGAGYTGGSNGAGGAGGTGYGCFYGCSGLTTLPSDLFKYNTEVTNFGGSGGSGGSGGTGGQGGSGYSGASTGTTGSQGSTGGAGGTGYGCFYGCSGLTTLPSDLFKYNTKVTNFGGIAGYGGTGGTGGQGGTGMSGTFGETSNTGGTGGAGGAGGTGGAGYGCFSNCSGLTTLPSALFKYNINVTNFGGYGGGAGRGGYGGRGGTGGSGSVYSSSSPHTWDGGKGGKGGQGAKGGTGGSSWGCFYNCTSLTTLPTNLLRDNSKLVTLGKDGNSNSSGSSGSAGSKGSDATSAYHGSAKGGDGGTGGTGGSAGVIGQGYGVFYGCAKTEVIMRFNAENITSVRNFAYGTKDKGTVYVPTGSTTASSFRADSTANVNVVEE